MKKIILITTTILFSIYLFGCGTRWTVESARQEAFKNVQYKIDVSKYPKTDPDFQENQKAVQSGRQKVGNRCVTKQSSPPVGYIVSTLDERGRPTITMNYREDGRLMAVRLFSSLDYPRVAYIYCVECNFFEGDNWKPGELLSVSFRPSEREDYYFLPNKRFSGRVTF